LEHQFMVYLRVWKSNVAGSIIRPLLYVLGMGLGVGSLVDDGPRGGQLLGDLTYFQFFAPAIIATTAMQVLTNDSLWPIRGGFIWSGTFHSQATTPINAGEVVSGLLLWHLAKGVLSSAGVAIVLAGFGSTRTWGLLAATAFGALAGVAYSAPLVAFSASRRTDLSYPNIMRFVIVPMFLFSGAFYPIDELPRALEIAAQFTPIWHGVELCRGAVHGTLDAATTAGHVLFLIGWIVVGWLASRRVFTRKLGL
jgi:lipooligosaccharide transport system permease protein